MTKRVDIPRLYAALDAERTARGLSWRQLAVQAEVSPGLFVRMAKGHYPDLDGFSALVGWLGISADQFLKPPLERPAPPTLETRFSLLLNNEPDLTPANRIFLATLIATTIRYLRNCNDV